MPFDESLELLQKFTESNEFFDDYSHVDLVELICVMDILHFNPNAPITKLGETSTWVGIVLKGTIDVFVKGTKVGKIPTGAMIGDTGTIEGGKRSADCEGSEGGGVVALLRFDKMDKLHVHQPRLAYKLAMSFGGVVVQKLRQAMGKIFKKDNEARAGESIGRRRLQIQREYRYAHKYRLPDDPSSEEEEDSGADTPTDFEAAQLAKEKAKKRWAKVQRAMSISKTFSTTADVFGENEKAALNEEEVLYLARAKRIRNSLSEQAERKLKEQVEKLTEEVSKLREQVKANSEGKLTNILAAHVAVQACRRYEKRWIRDRKELLALRYSNAQYRATIEELKTEREHTKKGYDTTLHDMEDELEWMRGKEKLLEANAAESEKTSKKLRVRLQAESEQRKTEVAKLEERGREMENSISRINSAMVQLKKELFAASKKTRELEAKASEDARRSSVRRAWMRAVCLSLCRRLHTVRRVAKIRQAWWDAVHRERDQLHRKTMETIKQWEHTLERMKATCAETERKSNQQNSLRQKSDARAAVMTVGNWCLMCTILGKVSEIQQQREVENALRAEIRRLEKVIVARDARVSAAYHQLRLEKESCSDVEMERMKVWTELRKALRELDEKDDVVQSLKDRCLKVKKEGEKQLRHSNTFLLESDRENRQMMKDRDALRDALGDIIRRVFSSECRRVELEQSFGSLTKPSPQMASLLSNAGFAVDLNVRLHRPGGAEDDASKIMKRKLERGWNSPVARPRTAPELSPVPNSPRMQRKAKQMIHENSPPPIYPSPDATRRGGPDFEDGTARTKSSRLFDVSRQHYIHGLVGNTSHAGRKRFWGSSTGPKKLHHRVNVPRVVPSPASSSLLPGQTRGKADRWYHHAFSQKLKPPSSPAGDRDASAENKSQILDESVSLYGTYMRDTFNRKDSRLEPSLGGKARGSKVVREKGEGTIGKERRRPKTAPLMEENSELLSGWKLDEESK